MNLAISHILVPVDFSPHSDRALRYATALASRVGASVDVLHVVEDPIATGAWDSEVVIPDLPDLRKALIEDAEKRLQTYRTTIEAPRVPVITTVRMGRPSQMIIEYAKAPGADLIVMGTHGRTGLAHLFMGSVAERVLRHAPCPVLTLRETAARDEKAAAAAPESAAVRSTVGHRGASRE